MNTILFIIFILISTISFTNQSGVILFTDVTKSNLPIQTVTGPTMDAVAGDLDNDGDPDIVLAREFAPNKILINNGSGQFTDGTLGNLPQFNYDSEDIGIADFNGDGFNDIVFASEDNAIHELYFNNGNGSFSNMNNRLPSSIANAVLAEDINNDSLPDIILGNAGQDLILINNGDSTFTNETGQRLPTESNVNQDLKLADIDGDGDKDLVAGNEDGNKIYINNGDGIFSDETSQRLPSSQTEETRKVTLGDVDGDHDPDIFFANVAFIPGRTRQDRLLLNNGIGIFTDVTSTNLPVDNEQTTEGIFEDIDFDNDLDLITSNIFFNRPIKIFENNGIGIFTEVTNTVLPPNTVAEGIGVFGADLNNDGLTDLYLQNRHTAQQTTETDRLLIRNDTGAVQIFNTENENPVRFKLHQNFPNPFNPETIIKYELSEAGYTELKIYDIQGKLVGVLVNENQGSGEYSVKFDGSRLAGGVYYYKLSVNGGDKVMTKKLVLLK
ncbi:MAG: FG-GAP-like repeat-containing protein [Ignavibacteria bacterium]